MLLKDDMKKRCSCLNKARHRLSFCIEAEDAFCREDANFSQSYGEEHHFIHLEPVSGNLAFPAPSEQLVERAKAGARKGLTLLPAGLPESLSLPSPTLSAGGDGENAGVSNGKRAGSCLASCSKSAEQPASLPD